MANHGSHHDEKTSHGSLGNSHRHFLYGRHRLRHVRAYDMDARLNFQLHGALLSLGELMARWIEWIPEMAHGVHQQLLHEAGKHSSVIWLIEPPPMVRVSCTPLEMKAIQHYIDEGGVPVGWVDQQGYVHAFRLKPPFDPRTSLSLWTTWERSATTTSHSLRPSWAKCTTSFA
jgi:hypothetical protein